MKNGLLAQLKKFSVVVLVGAVVAACSDRQTSNQAAGKNGATANASLAESAQKITGHRVFKKYQDRMVIELQTAQSTPGPVRVVIPFTFDKATGRYNEKPKSHMRIAWWGSDFVKKRQGDPNELYVKLAPVYDRHVVMAGRPHAHAGRYNRSLEDVALQIAVVEYLNQKFGIKSFDLIGISSGASSALAVLNARPELVTSVDLISPALATMRRYEDAARRNGTRIPSHAFNQWDPIDHVTRIPKGVPITIYHDLGDTIVKMNGVQPWLDKATSVGVPFKFVTVKMGGSERHADLKVVGWERQRPPPAGSN